eukprot:TRINITY_DN12606_c0_g1_i1.p1 TRINITY_DN12606_c0_g1~~TRINITY_DN12606_c0_g1_i1.p1  ORF type:complete len:292 (-),score=85.40 TRINITY_DN12606_c0_g1_i1:76-951(-)
MALDEERGVVKALFVERNLPKNVALRFAQIQLKTLDHPQINVRVYAWGQIDAKAGIHQEILQKAIKALGDYSTNSFILAERGVRKSLCQAVAKCLTIDFSLMKEVKQLFTDLLNQKESVDKKFESSGELNLPVRGTIASLLCALGELGNFWDDHRQTLAELGRSILQQDETLFSDVLHGTVARPIIGADASAERMVDYIHTSLQLLQSAKSTSPYFLLSYITSSMTTQKKDYNKAFEILTEDSQNFTCLLTLNLIEKRGQSAQTKLKAYLIKMRSHSDPAVRLKAMSLAEN